MSGIKSLAFVARFRTFSSWILCAMVSSSSTADDGPVAVVRMFSPFCWDIMVRLKSNCSEITCFAFLQCQAALRHLCMQFGFDSIRFDSFTGQRCLLESNKCEQVPACAANPLDWTQLTHLTRRQGLRPQSLPLLEDVTPSCGCLSLGTGTHRSTGRDP